MTSPDKRDSPDENGIEPPDYKSEVTPEQLRQRTGDIHDALEQPLQLTSDQVKLAERRERGEVNHEDFDMDTLIQLAEYGTPLRKEHVGNHAVVLTPEDILRLNTLTFIDKNGNEIDLDWIDLNEPAFILFPEDLGD